MKKNKKSKLKKIKQPENVDILKIEDEFPFVSATDRLSISEWEIRNGRGFWGNETTGYIYDKNN
jgi:hypothetical protein